MTKILILAALVFAVADGIAVAGGATKAHSSSVSNPEMPQLLTGL